MGNRKWRFVPIREIRGQLLWLPRPTPRFSHDALKPFNLEQERRHTVAWSRWALGASGD
jgi:hypothetical protein